MKFDIVKYSEEVERAGMIIYPVLSLTTDLSPNKDRSTATKLNNQVTRT